MSISNRTKRSGLIGLLDSARFSSICKQKCKIPCSNLSVGLMSVGLMSVGGEGMCEGVNVRGASCILPLIVATNTTKTY